MTLRWLEDRRLWWALSGLAALLAITSAVDHGAVQAGAWTLVAGGWLWHGERTARRTPPAVPAHVDEVWAREVIAGAGEPSGVAAVRALRTAEPALSLLQATELADRARA
jgi:hypothetical protein